MHYALLQAAPQAHVVQAFDINEIANDVYEHNFGHRPWEGNIETVSIDTFLSLAVNALSSRAA